MGAQDSLLMLLDHLQDSKLAGRITDEAMGLARLLFPICRSITGEGVRQTLDRLSTWMPLVRHEVASGTPVFDWEVPLEWNVEDAYVADAQGRRVIDFRANNLHLVSYSVPVRRTMSLAELQPHLHSLPEHPDCIPYRTSYYREHWGFCLRHCDRELLGPGPYEVVILSQLRPGTLSYGECIVHGTTLDEAIVYTHTCHPSLANDNVSGMAIAAALAREMQGQCPRLTWRFIFGPSTIGSLTWLSRNESVVPRVRGGFVLGLLGDGAALTYKRSRRGDTATDRVAQYVLSRTVTASRLVDFEPYGYDERQFCSPGFDLPIGRLTRSCNGGYAEYHTSADNLALLQPDKLSESLQVAAAMLAAIDADRRPVNLMPKGEPRLGKRGLYGAVGGTTPGEFEHALLWILSMADGKRTLVEIAQRSDLPLTLIEKATTALERSGLLHFPDEESSQHRGPVK